MANDDEIAEQRMSLPQSNHAEPAGPVESTSQVASTPDEDGLPEIDNPQEPEPAAENGASPSPDLGAEGSGDQQKEREPVSYGSDDKGVATEPSRKIGEKDIAADAEDSAIAIGDHARATNTKLDLSHANIGELIFKKDAESEKPSLVEVSAQEQKKIADVFVAPENYQARLTGLANREQRVFVVYGAEQSGKYTCAVKLPLALQASKNASESKVTVYRRSVHDRYSLVDFAHHPDVKAGTTYIVEDAFENGVRLIDLTGPDLPALRAALTEKDNQLILTTEYTEEQLAALQVAKISARVAGEQMLLVLRKHLAYYENENAETRSIPSEVIELADKNSEKLAACFHLPPQVDMFCDRLRGLSINASEEMLFERAEWVRRLGEEPRLWFDKLSKNSRLYAMLVVLFDSVDRHTLDDIYVTAIQELRLQGVTNLRDPREQGLNDLLVQLHARENEAHQVRFDSPTLEREARRQIDNHRHLLWSLLNLLLATIENYQASQYWEFRNALGAAIGALGIYQPQKLTRALEQLADHPSGGVVAVVGYALDQICRSDVTHHDFVVSLLEEWTRSGDPNRVWAVPASIWRLYDGLALSAAYAQDPRTKAIASITLVKIREILKLVAERFDKFNAPSQRNALRLALGAPPDAMVSLDEKHPFLVVLQYYVIVNEWALKNVGSILHAIRQMCRSRAADVVDLLKSWLHSDSASHLREIAVLGGHQLFYENNSPDLVLTAERHAPLLDLIGPLLSADASTAQVVMQALLRWLKSPGWANQVHRALLRVANRADEQDAMTLRTVLLDEWLDSDSPDAHRIASSVVGRLYMMRGTPMDMPKSSLAVIALDATPEARRGRGAARWGYLLHVRLDALIDTWVVRMGQREPLAKPGELKSSLQLQPDYPRSRLLATSLDSLNSLDSFDPLKVSMALVLAWQPPLDAEDLIGGSWQERILVEAVGESDCWPKAPIPAKAGRRDNNADEQWWAELVKVPTDSPNPDDLEDVMLRCLARWLSARSPDQWWSAVCKSIDLPQDDITRISEKLTDWTTLFEDEQHGEVARTILCSVLWLSGASPTQCVQLLKAWLESSNELTKLAGAACSTAVFRMYTECQPSPDLERFSVLLGIAPSLAKEGWRRVKAVIAAARQWSDDPAWAARLLTRPDGNPGELIEMVNSLPQSDRADLDVELVSWREANAGQKEPSEHVQKLVLRMQVQLALVVRADLPRLPADHTYVMLVLDHANGRSRTCQEIAQVASRFVEKLADSPEEKIHVLTYRLGQDVPIAGPEERPTAEQLAALTQPLRPRTIGPLLQMHSPQQIGAVLLLVDSPPLDAEDWDGTEWSRRVIVHNTSGRPHEIPAFYMVPQQPTSEATENLIIEKLRQTTGV